jgi:hypothetical protein
MNFFRQWMEQQVGKVGVFVLPGLSEFLLANRIQGVVQVALDMKVVEYDREHYPFIAHP